MAKWKVSDSKQGYKARQAAYLALLDYYKRDAYLNTLLASRLEGIDLERIRFKLPAGRYSDVCKNLIQPGIHSRLQRPVAALFANTAFGLGEIRLVTGH